MKRRMTRRGVVIVTVCGAVGGLLGPRLMGAAAGYSLVERLLWIVVVGVGLGVCIALAVRLLDLRAGRTLPPLEER